MSNYISKKEQGALAPKFWDFEPINGSDCWKINRKCYKLELLMIMCQNMGYMGHFQENMGQNMGNMGNMGNMWNMGPVGSL